MGAILNTAGPLSTAKAVRWSSKYLRTTTIKQFIAASTMLQQLGLGQLAIIRNQVGGRETRIFVKASLQDAMPIIQLAENSDLCSVEQYGRRYAASIPTCINLKMRAKLVEMGLVTQRQML